MIKSILLGVAVAFAVPIAWVTCFFAYRWMLGNALKPALLQQGRAVGMGFVAGKFVELLIWGLLVGIVVAVIMYFVKWRAA